MQNKIITIFIALLSTTLAFAQPGELSTPMSFQYMLDNPAAAGLDGRHHIMLGAYQKWFNLDDAPQTLYLSTSHTIINRSFGLGFTVVQDKAALLKNTRANINLALHLNPDNAHRFSVGATARYQQTGFGIPNVVDPFLAESPSSNGINLGLGINYNFNNDNGTELNLQLQSPLLPATLELTDAKTDSILSYNLEQALVFQANLRYPIGGGNYLSPSLRFQGELGEEGGLSKTQIIDIGLGLSFLEDVLNLRLGYRTGAASMLYGGVGFSFGEGSQAHLLYEPTGPFGASAAATADFAFGNPESRPPRSSKQEELACYKNSKCLQDRWLEFNDNQAFEISSNTNPGSQYTYLTIAFGDDINNYFDLFEHQDFLVGIPLDKLATAIQKLYIEELGPKGHEIVQVNFRAVVQNNLDDDSYESFSGEALRLEYLQEGKPPVEETISAGANLTEAQLAALKLQYLGAELLQRIPAISSSTIRNEVSLDNSVLSSREMQIVLIIR